MGAIHDLDLALQLEPRNPVALSSRGDAKRMRLDEESTGDGEYLVANYPRVVSGL